MFLPVKHYFLVPLFSRVGISPKSNEKALEPLASCVLTQLRTGLEAGGVIRTTHTDEAAVTFLGPLRPSPPCWCPWWASSRVLGHVCSASWKATMQVGGGTCLSHRESSTVLAGPWGCI